MKRSLTIWMLLAGVAVLGGLIYLLERGGPDSRRVDPRTLFAVFPESIERIVTERDGVEIECIRENGVWRMVRPVQAAVDSAVVERMIAAMARVERGERITARTLRERGLSPADYGLDEPRARITFKNNRGTFTWLIGRDAPLGDALYVQQKGQNDLVSAPRTLLHLVPQDPSWIRDRTLFSADAPSVRGIDLGIQGVTYRLRHVEAAGWRFLEPWSGRADLSAVHALIEKTLSARIVDFIADGQTDLAAYGLDDPALVLTVFTRNERTRTLHIGSPLADNAELRAARHSPGTTIFSVPASWCAELEQDPARLRSRRLTDLQPERITAVRLVRGEQQVELVRTNGLWQILRPVRWPADGGRVQELLLALTGASVEEFVNEPTEEQSARIRSAPWEVELTAGARRLVLRFSAPGANDRRLVQLDDEPSFCLVPVATVREAYADPLFYRSPLLLSISPSEIRQLSVRSTQGEQTVYKTDSGSFSGGPGEERSIDGQALGDLMWTLNDLRADRFTVFNPDTLEPYGLEEPFAEVKVLLEDLQSIGRVLKIGHAAEGGRYALLQGQPVVFVLPERSVQSLTAGLFRPAETAVSNE